MSSCETQTNLPTIEQLLDWTRQLITAYGAATESLWQRLETHGQDNDLMKTAGELFVATGMTTESIIILIEHGLIWDAISLFRSVLEGTARFCYLLSAPSPEGEQNRLKEFENVMGDREMARLSRWVATLKKGHLYKSGKADEYIDRAEIAVQEAALKENDGAGAVMSKWSFGSLSKQLREECPEWKNMADLWEFRYATANFAIHKTALSLMPDMLYWNRELGPGNLLVQVWGPSLLSFCVMLVHTRIAVFMRHLDIDATGLHNVLEEYLSFSHLAMAMELEARERWEKQVRGDGVSTRATGE